MEIEKLRRLWYLSTVPTHSPASLAEQHQLLRELMVEEIGNYSKIPVCDLCVNHAYIASRFFDREIEALWTEMRPTSTHTIYTTFYEPVLMAYI